MNAIDFIQLKCEQLAENKIFIGLMMIMVNVGARFIIEELSDEHRAIAKGDIFRKVVIFCSVFMATRDIVMSLIVTIIFVILMNEVLGTKDKEVDDKKEGEKGASFAKQELDKQIDQLKLIKDSL
jgi:hypothetical protein